MLLTYEPNNYGVLTATLARLSLPPPPNNRRCDTLQRLMDASQQQLENVARQDNVEEAWVAQRILECPVSFLHWEHEHTEIMRSVAATTCVQEQKRRLLAAVLSLLHRKSLFEYLRDHQVHDCQRELLLMHFHGGNDYARAMVIEHGNYLRSAASYLCSTFIGLRLMNDARFAKPLDEYALLYAGYFATYSKLLLNPRRATSNLRTVAYKLKRRLGLRRSALLGTTQSLH